MTAAPLAVRHRRRGPALEEAIHEAVFAELAEVGYAAFTIESVAARARTGKASIYRRWPTKQELVFDAYCARFGDTLQIVQACLDDQTTTRDALLDAARRMRDVVRDSAEAIRATAFEMSRDADMAAALEKQVRCQKRNALLDLLYRGVQRHEVRLDAPFELVVEVLPAMVMFRLVLQSEQISDDLLVRYVDEIVMPLLRPA